MKFKNQDDLVIAIGTIIWSVAMEVLVLHWFQKNERSQSTDWIDTKMVTFNESYQNLRWNMNDECDVTCVEIETNITHIKPVTIWLDITMAPVNYDISMAT